VMEQLLSHPKASTHMHMTTLPKRQQESTNVRNRKLCGHEEGAIRHPIGIEGVKDLVVAKMSDLQSLYFNQVVLRRR